MAANAPPELASGNPCCIAWQGKYIAMKKSRDYCKQARDILQQAMDKANLEKSLGEMAADRDTKGDDSAVRASLEKEIADLKQRLEQSLKEKSEETKLLKDQASRREKEISELKNLLKKEKLRREFLAEELGRLKLEFGSLTNRMNLLDEYFSRGVEGTAGLAKAKGCRKRSGAHDQARKVAENSLQSRQRDSHEVVNEHPRKRKRMSEAVESRKHLSSADKKKKLQIGEKLGTLQSMVVETGYRPVEEEETLVPDMQGGSSAKCITISKKKRVTFEEKTSMQNSLEFNRSAMTGNKAMKLSGKSCLKLPMLQSQKNHNGEKHSDARCQPRQVPEKTMCLSTAKGHDAAALLLEDVVATDYMKLLELDKPEEESYYRMARESLLSPDLSWFYHHVLLLLGFPPTAHFCFSATTRGMLFCNSKTSM